MCAGEDSSVDSASQSSFTSNCPDDADAEHVSPCGWSFEQNSVNKLLLKSLQVNSGMEYGSRNVY